MGRIRGDRSDRIMARRLTLEGAKVKLVAELMPYSGGLKRNIVRGFNIYKLPEFLRLYPKVEMQQCGIDKFNYFSTCSLVSGTFFCPLVAIYCCYVASFCFLSEFFYKNAVHLELW